MSLFYAEYYLRWVATSADHSKDTLYKVYIEAPNWNAAREEIVATEELLHEHSKVEFRLLSKIDGVLWK